MPPIVQNSFPPVLTYAQVLPRQFLPDEDMLNAINAIVPWWFIIYDGTIGPQQTDRGQITVQEDCWLTSIIASSAQAAGFVVQLFETGDDGTFMDDDILNGNFAGTAQRKHYLHQPQHIKVGDQLESRIINLATVSNAIQVVGFGLRPDMRKNLHG